MTKQETPAIRFNGFTNDWEQRKLGDYGYFYYGKSAPKWSLSEDAKTPCVRYGELYTKYNEKIDKVISYTNIPPENLKFSNGTEVLVPRVGEKPLEFAKCSWLSVKDVAIGEMISVYNTEQNPLFTVYYFNSQLKYEFAKRVEGGNVSNLYFSYLEDILISMPSIEEQKKISEFLSKLSQTIALQERKLDLLKEQKKGFLQKMFPKKDEKVPEIRFKGFTDDWEQRKFIEFTKISQGLQIAISERFLKDGKDRLFYITNEFLNPNSSVRYYIENAPESVIANVDDILMTRTGNTGKVVSGVHGAFHNNFFKIAYNKLQTNKLFLYVLLNSDYVQNEIRIGAGSSTIPDLKHPNFYRIQVKIPLLEEQTKIGNFFKQLDDTIALQEREVTELKAMKKSFLQKMFV